jgi:hypothetical protein
MTLRNERMVSTDPGAAEDPRGKGVGDSILYARRSHFFPFRE